MYGIDNVECRGIEIFFRDCLYVFGVNIDCSGIDEYVSVMCIIFNNVLFSCRFFFFIILYINVIFFLSIIYINKKLIKMSIFSKKVVFLLYYL